MDPQVRLSFSYMGSVPCVGWALSASWVYRCIVLNMVLLRSADTRAGRPTASLENGTSLFVPSGSRLTRVRVSTSPLYIFSSRANFHRCWHRYLGCCARLCSPVLWSLSATRLWVPSAQVGGLPRLPTPLFTMVSASRSKQLKQKMKTRQMIRVY